MSATAIQTVGSKGYDGFAIALVTSEPPAQPRAPTSNGIREARKGAVRNGDVDGGDAGRYYLAAR